MMCAYYWCYSHNTTTTIGHRNRKAQTLQYFLVIVIPSFMNSRRSVFHCVIAFVMAVNSDNTVQQVVATNSRSGVLLQLGLIVACNKITMEKSTCSQQATIINNYYQSSLPLSLFIIIIISCCCDDDLIIIII